MDREEMRKLIIAFLGRRFLLHIDKDRSEALCARHVLKTAATCPVFRSSYLPLMLMQA